MNKEPGLRVHAPTTLEALEQQIAQLTEITRAMRDAERPRDVDEAAEVERILGLIGYELKA